MFDPATGIYGINLLPALGHHHRLFGHHDRRDRHRLPAARRPLWPLRDRQQRLCPRLRLHRRRPRRETTPASRAATRTRSTRATGSRAPRTRAATSRAAARATARGTARTCRARSAPSRTTHGLPQNVAGINQVSKIQPLRVLGKCGGYTTDIADAIRWAAGLDVTGVPHNPTPDHVINISLGGTGACDSTFAERDQRGRQRGHGRRRRGRQQQRRRGELRAGELRRRRHGRRDRPHRQPRVLLELRHLGRDRGAGR